MRNHIICLALLAFGATPPLFAKAIIIEADVPTIVVSYADLNVGTPAGRSRLQTRIRHAAETLCLDHNVRDVERSMSGRTCYNRAIGSASGQMQDLAKVNGPPTTVAVAAITISAPR